MDDPLPGYSVFTILLAQPDLYYFVAFSLLMAFLFLGSALVSGSEVAYFALTRDKLEESQISDNHKRKISNLIAHPKKLLATILILNNFINISIVMIATYFSIRVLGDTYSPATIIATLTIIVTILIVFLGEIIPKVYANQRSLAFAKRTAGLLSIFYKMFSPLSWLLINVSNIIEKHIEKKGYSVSVDELNEALEIATDTDANTEEEKVSLKE